jgi:ribosomal protein S18 acetylase RimI-like enzyme
VPLTGRQIDYYVKQYFGFISPDYVKIIVDEKNNLAGFVIGMPSLTKALQKSRGRLFPFGFLHILKALRKSNKYVDLYLGAIRPDLQGKGADALLMTELTRSCIKNKIISAESNIELETNVLVQGHWKYFNSRLHKRRRCFTKKI